MESFKAASRRPGRYPHRTGLWRLQWWDGTGWTGYFRHSPPTDRSSSRPAANPQTAAYTPHLWVVVLLPVVSLVLLMNWYPVVAYIIEDGKATAFDAPAMITVPLILLIASGWIVYGISVVLVYFDWQRLRRDVLDRPYHWAWAFLGAPVYVIGRTAILRQAEPRAGLAPVWVLITVTALLFIALTIKMVMLLSKFTSIT